MASKITQKIVSQRIVKDEEQEIILEEMHEGINRPDSLVGSTYKVKTPQIDHALYITINDYILNAGTSFEKRIPYEIFINSKNMEHYQWVIALTRVISAVFRKGGDVCFLVDELMQVFDPKGGYFKRGKFIPSLVAEIGNVLHQHMVSLNMIDLDKVSSNSNK